MLHTKLRYFIMIFIISVLMTLAGSVLAEVDSETCTTTVQPELTTDSATVEYSISETDAEFDGLTGATATYTVDYVLEGTATVEDYGMVYAAARVYFRDNPTYDYDDIQDLMEVGTIVQQCGTVEGDFTSIQLLESSVSMLNTDVPTLSELGDQGWMYTYFFEVIEFEVTAEVDRQVTVEAEVTFEYSVPLADWYDANTGSLSLTYLVDENGDLILDAEGNPQPVDAEGNVFSLSDIASTTDGATLIFEPALDTLSIELDANGDPIIVDENGDPVGDVAVSLEYAPEEMTEGTDIDLAIRDVIADDMDGYEFEPYEVTDEEAVVATNEWKDALLNSDDPEMAEFQQMYLNADGELIDATSADNGGEEEGGLQFAAETNGQFDEGRTNEFDCAGQGNSCNNRSANAQNNGYMGDVNKFGCIGRGNSCNAGQDSDSGVSANEAAQSASSNESSSNSSSNGSGNGNNK